VPAFSLRARRPSGGVSRAAVTRDPEILSGYLEDAAHFPGGRADQLVTPATEAELADALRAARTALPIGAQSSLTGGATPLGGTVISTRRFTGIELVGADRVRAGAGVALQALVAAVESAGRYYPAAPTFDGAFIGGAVGTNAAGAATFKYGATRDWVEALTVILPSGDVLDVERGATRASPEGYFELQLQSGAVRVPVPRYRTPRLPKLSAGYFAAPGMDLIDLFIGSEGTLGVFTSVMLRLQTPRPAVCQALVPFPDESAALRFTAALRDASRETWRSCRRSGIDAAAIEYMDGRSLDIVREDRAATANGVALPPHARAALLVQLELPAGTGTADAFDQIGRARDEGRPDTPLVRFCTMLLDAGVFDDVEIALPEDGARAAQLAAVREAVPAGVNSRIAMAKQRVDDVIEKTAADIAVPFERLGELVDEIRASSRERGLEAIVWGHASDGNLHPNFVPRSRDELAAAKAAVADIGRFAIRVGGAPMAEHGVGRNPIKQQLLRELYGSDGIEDMRAVKRAIDPAGKLSPGVLFPAARTRRRVV
jgi:D-lactate dehydrogenase (cytochrome)